MKRLIRAVRTSTFIPLLLVTAGCAVFAQDSGKPRNTEPRPTAGGKPLPNSDEVARKQRQYLEKRYDLSGRTHPSVKMSGGRKAVPVGPTARLSRGVTWAEA